MEDNIPILIRDIPIIDAGEYIRKKYLKVLVVIILISAIFEFLIILSGFFQLSFFLLFILLGIYAHLRQKAEDAFFQQFAAVNAFSFQKTGLPMYLEGSLFTVGHSQLGRDLVSGNFQDIPFDLFNYQYTVGNGKNSHTYIYTVFRLDFDSSLPPLLLKPKYCFWGGFMSGDISDEARERLNLEGDFNKYFDLWIKKDYEIEALQFMTPDVMTEIQNKWQKFSLEFINGQVCIYSSHMITKDEELDNMYQFVQYLIPKIAHFAKDVKGDILALNDYYRKID